MQNYYIVKMSNLGDLKLVADALELAMVQFSATGIEDFSIDEARVDEILGERSYSGADLPQSVVDEVEETVLAGPNTQKIIYFSSFNDAKAFKTYLDSIKINSEIEEKEVKDWNKEWKKSYAPILVTDELEIIPSWNKDNYNSKAEHQVYIYPGMGFGTGNHETTFLCLKLLFETKFNFKNITCMDFGCGSGILGLTLRKIQKDSLIDLYDIDQNALDNCKQNVELNDLSEIGIRYQLPEDKAQFLKGYDIIFANILKNILEIESDCILSLLKTNGILIVSGLLDGQQEDIIDLYTDKLKTLEFKMELKKGDWVAILFENNK